MAGHHKWSKVKHLKAREDAKKGKLFNKFAHEISIAARDDRGNTGLNPRFRIAIDTAKAQSAPPDSIERAIKKGTVELKVVASASQAVCLFEASKDCPDTLKVFPNFDIPDAVFEKMAHAS